MLAVPEWVKRTVIGFTFFLAILIVVVSVGVLVAWMFGTPPTAPAAGASKDIVDGYSALVTARLENLTTVYDEVVVKGLLEMFKAIITAVLTFVLVPHVAKALRQLAVSLGTR